MPSPNTQLVSFPLALGVDQISDPEAVSPLGERPRVVQSLNTRLTKVPGRVKKSPGTALVVGSAPRCGGIVPHGELDSSIAFFHQSDSGNKRVAGSVAAIMNTNAFWPVNVARAGAITASCYLNPATCYDASTGYSYFAYALSASTDPGAAAWLTMTVLDDNGRVVVSPTFLISLNVTAAEGTFIALTCHGPGVVRLWYCLSATEPIRVTGVTVSGLLLSISGGGVVFDANSEARRSIAIASDPLDTANVYMACFAAASFSTHLMRIDAVAMTVSQSLDVATGADSSATHAIAYVHDGTSGKLIWMVSWTGGNCSLFEANPTTLATIWSQTNRMWVGHAVSCGFFRVNGYSQFMAVYAASRVGTVATTGTPGGTKVEFRAIGTGSLQQANDIPWYGLVGQIATLKVESANGYYPLLPVQVLYDGTNRYDPTSIQFVSDPSIEVLRPYWGGAAYFWQPVARLGTDFCIRYSSNPLGGCNSFIAFGSQKARLVYLAEAVDGIALSGYAPRYVDLDFAGAQPAYAHLSAGPAIIAGALPAVWDGYELTELAPLRAPKLTGLATGGNTALTGTYLFAVVMSWKDSSGRTHRSAPSNIVTLSPAATNPRLFVVEPVTYRNGAVQGPVWYTVYASQNGGTTLYAQNYAMTVVDAYWRAFNSLTQPVQNSLTPAIYTDGSSTQIKPSYCPNACGDVAVVGDRVWLLDAEMPGRAYYSQPISTEALEGIFPSFNPTQYVDFPASAGALRAVENFREQPYFHADNGVWTVDGEGPDALNNPPYFSSPRQVSDIPCRDRQSVLQTPIGIMFRSRNRMAVFAGEAVVMDDVLADQSIVCVAVFRDQHEVVFIAANGTAFVLNYKRAMWTIWGTDTWSAGASLTAAVQVPASRKVLYYSASNSELRLMDPETVSATAQISILTGWLGVDDPQQDNSLSNYVVRARRGGAHAVALQVGTDYQALQPAKSYSAADVLAAVSGDRYDLWPEVRDQAARAMQLSLVESGATGDGFEPISVTYEVLRRPGKRADSLKQAGRK